MKTTKKTTQFIKKHIQGDVMLVVVDLPEGLKPAEKGAEVLALGETSGHGHVLEDCDIMIGADEAKYVIPSGKNARLLHKHLTSDRPADHRPIDLTEVLPAGKGYKVVLQQRYNPFEQLFQRVAD